MVFATADEALCSNIQIRTVRIESRQNTEWIDLDMLFDIGLGPFNFKEKGRFEINYWIKGFPLKQDKDNYFLK